MPRLPITLISRVQPSRTLVSAPRFFSSTAIQSKGSQNSTPGWEGRKGDDHVVKRPEMDVQADASHSGMRKKEEGGDGSSALSEKDTGDHNQKAKEDHPEAPGPVIGMNDERGGKGH